MDVTAAEYLKKTRPYWLIIPNPEKSFWAKVEAPAPPVVLKTLTAVPVPTEATPWVGLNPNPPTGMLSHSAKTLPPVLETMLVRATSYQVAPPLSVVCKTAETPPARTEASSLTTTLSQSCGRRKVFATPPAVEAGPVAFMALLFTSKTFVNGNLIDKLLLS